MLAALDDAGIAVASVTVARPSLDDVYLRFAGRTLCGGGVTVATTRRCAFRPCSPRAGAAHAVAPAGLSSRSAWCSRSSGCCCSARCSGRSSTSPASPTARATWSSSRPGVIVMTALFSSGWAGTIYIEDMDRGVMDRLLASPVRRGAMMVGTLAYQALTTVSRRSSCSAIAVLAGARFPGATVGVLVTTARRGADLGRDRVVVERDRAACAPAGGADRDQPVHRAAAAVPVLGDHGDLAGSRLGAARRTVQPGRLGGRVRAHRADEPPVLAARRSPASAGSRCLRW